MTLALLRESNGPTWWSASLSLWEMDEVLLWRLPVPDLSILYTNKRWQIFVRKYYRKVFNLQEINIPNCNRLLVLPINQNKTEKWKQRNYAKKCNKERKKINLWYWTMRRIGQMWRQRTRMGGPCQFFPSSQLLLQPSIIRPLFNARRRNLIHLPQRCGELSCWNWSLFSLASRLRWWILGRFQGSHCGRGRSRVHEFPCGHWCTWSAPLAHENSPFEPVVLEHRRCRWCRWGAPSFSDLPRNQIHASYLPRHQETSIFRSPKICEQEWTED